MDGIKEAVLNHGITMNADSTSILNQGSTTNEGSAEKTMETECILEELEAVQIPESDQPEMYQTTLHVVLADHFNPSEVDAVKLYFI